MLTIEDWTCFHVRVCNVLMHTDTEDTGVFCVRWYVFVVSALRVSLSCLASMSFARLLQLRCLRRRRSSSRPRQTSPPSSTWTASTRVARRTARASNLATSSSRYAVAVAAAVAPLLKDTHTHTHTQSYDSSSAFTAMYINFAMFTTILQGFYGDDYTCALLYM